MSSVWFDKVPKRYRNDNEFLAMWAIREFKLGIVNVKQIKAVKDFLDIYNPNSITKETVIKLLERGLK